MSNFFSIRDKVNLKVINFTTLKKKLKIKKDIKEATLIYVTKAF